MSIKNCETMKKMGVPGKIIFLLMLLLHKSSQQEAFNDQATLNVPENEIRWMGTLDDEKLISHITIPGTHESLALHGVPAAKCQAWSLENQLKAGIRYFDLRVSGENMKIKHGPSYQHTTFSDALKTIKTFLSEYTTETVLVRVKPVHLFKSKVPDLVENVIKNYISWVAAEIPNIGQVRGKIIFVQKNDFQLGIPLFETDEHNDYIVTDERTVETKKEKIIKHLTEAKFEQNRAGKVVLNYSSGTGGPKWLFKSPKNVAREINPWLYDYLDNESKKPSPKPCFGVIAMDFPGLDLIRKIIEFNM